MQRVLMSLNLDDGANFGSIYLDDVTVYSRESGGSLEHCIFNWCYNVLVKLD